MNGVINVYKEPGYTSHDVVAKLRGILKMKKIGHTGTLDPQAEGVLPVCLGSATKLCDMLTDKTKEYEAVMRLGIETDTQDMTGTVLSQKEVTCDEVDINKVMSTFIGKQEQIPPMYSALKINGKKLYELAREGKEIERKARPIEIFTLEILEIDLPCVRFRVSCSKGTYIRTLCHDIGNKLGCGGCMQHLKRTRVERFVAEDALTLSQIEKLRDEMAVQSVLTKVDDMFDSYPKVFVADAFRKVIDNGNFISPCMFKETEGQFEVAQRQDGEKVGKKYGQKVNSKDGRNDGKKDGQRIRVYNEEQVFYGIYEYHEKIQQYKPYKMFLER